MAMDTQELDRCIDNCMECHRLCVECIPHCLHLGGAHADPGHIRLLMDCAQICQTSADFMIRRSPMHGHVCGVCAEACTSCAEDCERIAGNDRLMHECADMCRRCAESCREMAGAGV